jgi:uncharacterized membrane protein YhiD involved in acid resistance
MMRTAVTAALASLAIAGACLAQGDGEAVRPNRSHSQYFEPLLSQDTLISMARIGVAAFLGWLVGLERQRSTGYTGARVFVIFTAAACAYCLVAEAAVRQAGSGDVTRVAGQVVTGIGFVCAAFIFREHNALRGITTSVSLFMCGAIGVALGYGLLTEALAACIITVGTLLLTRGHEGSHHDDRGQGNGSAAANGSGSPQSDDGGAAMRARP